MGGGYTMEASHRLTHAVEDSVGLLFGCGFVVQHVDERATVEVFNDELAAFVVEVPNRWHGEACFPGANEQSSLADHSSNTQTMVQVGVSPRTRSTLFPHRRSPEPFPFPHLGLCAEVKAFGGVEGHDWAQPGFVFERSRPSVPSKRIEGWEA